MLENNVIIYTELEQGKQRFPVFDKHARLWYNSYRAK